MPWGAGIISCLWEEVSALDSLLEGMRGSEKYVLYFKVSVGNILPTINHEIYWKFTNTCYIEKYYNKLKTIGYEKLSFHAHNELGLALENSLRAAELGCYTIDTTFNGIGRGGGNLKLQELLENLPC